MDRFATASETDLDNLLHDKNSKHSSIDRKFLECIYFLFTVLQFYCLCYRNFIISISVWGGYWGGHIIKQILHTLSYLISQFIPPR